MTQDEIAKWFAYNAPTPEQIAAMQGWRERATELAKDFCENSPSGPDQTVAMRKLKEALMAMNAALVSPMPKHSLPRVTPLPPTTVRISR